jgi:hypothetical protein
MKAHLTHTTVLVYSVDRVAEFFKQKHFHINLPDVFESEGTREIYVGDFNENSSKILLVEPYGEGSYKKALKKRGAGLHHLGLDVDNLVEYCTALGQSGWLLHSHSLLSAPKLKTAYLVRPGVPLILEIREGRQKTYSPSLLKGMSIPVAKQYWAMIEALGVENAKVTPSESKNVVFETQSGQFSLREILASDMAAV